MIILQHMIYNFFIPLAKLNAAPRETETGIETKPVDKKVKSFDEYMAIALKVIDCRSIPKRVHLLVSHLHSFGPLVEAPFTQVCCSFLSADLRNWYRTWGRVSRREKRGTLAPNEISVVSSGKGKFPIQKMDDICYSCLLPSIAATLMKYYPSFVMQFLKMSGVLNQTQTFLYNKFGYLTLEMFDAVCIELPVIILARFAY